MTSRISKGSITGRAAFSNGGLGLSIGSKVSGGIRHAISRRAPDASKIAGAAPVGPIYKIKDTDSAPGVILTNTITPAKPYLHRISASYSTGAALQDLFTNNLQTLTLYFLVPAYGAAALDTYTVVLTSGSGATIESLFSKTTTNNYAFLLPAILESFTSTTQPFEPLTLYYNGTSFVSSGTGSNITVIITATANNRLQFDNNVKSRLFGKTFNMTLTADNNVIIPITGEINCGTYTGA
jgi:hypothetical protein